MVTVFLHCWQRTEQHQENLQEHRCTTSARPALYPGPQHTRSQPSGARREVPVLQGTILSPLVSFSCEMGFLPLTLPLHLLPAVPGIPFSGSRWQKSGEGARYRRSLAAGGFTWGSRGSRAVLDPIRVKRTWEEGRGRWRSPTQQEMLSVLQRVCVTNVPLWRRQSVPLAQCQRAWMEASPSNRSSTRKIQIRHDTCTPPACCEGWPEGAERVTSRVIFHKNVAKGRALPTFRPASLLWRFMSGRPADSPLARSGSSTNVWENATP